MGGMAANDWDRLAGFARERRVELGLTQEDARAAGGPSTATMRLIEGALQRSYQPATLRDLENVLRWGRGSVRKILAGGDPVPLADAAAAADTLTVTRTPDISFERGPDDIFPDMSPEMRALVEERVRDIEPLVRSAAIDGPLTGSRIFPASPHEAERWDRLTEVGQGMEPGKGYSGWQMLRLMAVGRIRDEERSAGNPPARLREVLTRR